MIADKNRKTVSDEIWLTYFNTYLFEKEIITESERNKMKNLITQICRAPVKKVKIS